MIPWALLTAAALAVMLLAVKRGHQPLRAIAKTLASTGFLGVAVAGGAAETPYGRTALAALALCWLGDVLLLWRHRGVFLAGLVSFLAGHVVFGVAFAGLGVSGAWIGGAAAAGVLVGAAVLRWLLPHLRGVMRGAVVAYVVVIVAMVALAAGAVGGGATPWLLAAAIAFFVSDLGVARHRFVEEAFINRALGLPLYYTAVTILAATAGGIG